jgi:CheY-like chemotaxis protein
MTNTILVVDDNPSSVAGLVDAFATSGLTATAAHGFTDALKRLKDVEPELLIACVRLGPYNGLHLVLRVRALYPNAAAILMGPADPMLARDARALGVDAYLTTHAPDAVLLEALKILGRLRSGGNGVLLQALAPAPAGAAVSPMLDGLS